MLGLHRKADMDALQTGMKTGALDDILFPANPVGDAPRIVNRYRELFPIEEDGLLLGPMFQLSFSQPPIVYLSVGLIFEVANALGGDRPAKLTKVILLGQVLVQLPPRDTKVPAILKLLIDIVGFYDAEEQFLMIRSRLRDSFVGIEGFAKLNLSGEQLIAMRFGAEPTFVLSSGGFHPAYKDVPAGVPLALERLAVSFGIGPIKIRAEQYFAITSNSVQTGLKIQVKADFGVASIEGWLSFDALLYLEPVFKFIAELGFHVAVRAFDRNIASVDVHMLLEGPGEWHASGSFSFGILWWDVEVGFDERWGNAPAVEASTTSALQLLANELGQPGHLEPGPPVGGSALVTLAAASDGQRVAHPLGILAIRQTAVPLGVQIDRVGTKRIGEGPSTFSIGTVKVNGVVSPATGETTDHFARGQFMELTDEEKLGGRSFEKFTSGVRVGTEAYVVPTGGRKQSAAYERKILEPGPQLNLHWRIAALDATLATRHTMTFALAEALVPLGAAGRSDRARQARLHAASTGPASMTAPPLVVVDPASLQPVASIDLSLVASPTVAEELARSVDGRVIEAYEVVE
jgi:hypothetical protein